MTSAELNALTTQVLWAAFAVGLAFGALVQRTGFCTMGAVSDAVAMGDFTRLRQWALAAAVATLGFGALSALGILRAPQTLYASTHWLWLSAIVGGGLFGFGMVLSSGCVSLISMASASAAGSAKLSSRSAIAVSKPTSLVTLYRANSIDRTIAPEPRRRGTARVPRAASAGSRPAPASCHVARPARSPAAAPAA